MNWKKQFVIIKKIIAEKLKIHGETFSQTKAERFLGVAAGRMQAWGKGQKPNADDLAILTRKLNLSPRWVLLCEGSPSCAESLTGKIVGDTLHDLIFGHIDMNLEKAAAALNMSPEELDQCMGRTPAPSWEVLQKLAKGGININFLLTGEGYDFIPPDQIGRMKAAIGVSTDWDLAQILGVKEKEIIEAKSEGYIEPEWREKLQELYGLNPGWLFDGEFPSHVKVHPKLGAVAELTADVERIELLTKDATEEEILDAVITALNNRRKKLAQTLNRKAAQG